jgi:hypothetical protein
MEPLAPASIAGLTPDDVDVRFYDDRLEVIPFDEATDLVAISIETYTARRGRARWISCHAVPGGSLDVR